MYQSRLMVERAGATRDCTAARARFAFSCFAFGSVRSRCEHRRFGVAVRDRDNPSSNQKEVGRGTILKTSLCVRCVCFRRVVDRTGIKKKNEQWRGEHQTGGGQKVRSLSTNDIFLAERGFSVNARRSLRYAMVVSVACLGK